MKRIIKRLFKYCKNHLSYLSFERKHVDSINKPEGEIVLFENKFFYHHEMAFYNTYKEIFEKCIYNFKINNSSPIIIDCGANMGLSVLYFSKKYPNAEIIAFEPDESVLPFLEKNILSQDLKNVVLNKKAVWIEETELKFYTDNGLGGRVERVFENQNPKIVETVRLRNLLCKPIEMLKIDIEGPEYIILKDCEDLLFNVNHIFVEYHSFFDEEQHLDDLLSILKRQGFRYHLKESFSRQRPFIDNVLVNEKFDMAINVFAYKG
ncbi:FkbM family methyltransferase [Flavobacterium sp. ALD4]|uniref:FkbM family methyltransferase n=1 Tax=Flavobacterium sp. ALD4 TaxID=2058314 RepID=UPI000C343F44|nr:FkbM family methyltransferase [Flavobacterium sp. ALD4]PKH67671.1 FkbM family methyltransferase [Flavobacterium sp. ALD4]